MCPGSWTTLTVALLRATVCNVTMSHRQLTDLQQAILDFIWKAGPSTAEQIREGLAPKHELKDSTVRTLLRRLEERDYLTHAVDGKVFVYQASVPPRSLAARSVKQIIERFWSGSAEQFLAGMVDEKVLTPAQIRRLAARIKDSK
jgi:BlaI family transcriptional regulator, penicillinase repressor